MPNLVRPFRALRPRPERAADVIAPPYDVVSTDEARALAAGRPASFLHISRPEIDLPTGTSPYSDAAYARGAANLARLVNTGALVRDAEPSYYVYRIEMQGRVQTGVALVGSVAAYEANRIRRHELTRPDKENDRVRNIDALNAQTGPVLLAYRANAALGGLVRDAASSQALLAARGPNETRHTVWRVAEPERVAAFTAAFDALDALYIADGHHRSAAALRVAHARRDRARAAIRGAVRSTAARDTPDASYEYFLAVAFPHDEMRILDYNRVVRDLNGLTADALLARIGESFEVMPSAGPVAPAQPETFGLFVGGRWYRLRIRVELVPRGDPVASLDVSLLQDRLLAPILGLGDPRTDPRIDFVGGVRGLDELERRVASGRDAAAFALHPTRMEQLMAVADAGRLMPPKSTWFEPKLADGLLSHVLD
ncbi:MAG TPA: DUF1015 family protein [Gammaproteobacteria bacterium]|nr:DUF1015 family protein [Gammaproteobacteria bacterium]